VAGRYEAYGQNLTIEDGRLLFAGTPLDNPRLAITAMRKVDDDLSTGVRIAGTAKRPIVTVISAVDGQARRVRRRGAARAQPGARTAWPDGP
jgi:hypothetical protein